MKRYYLICLWGMIAFLLFLVSCNHFDGGKDELTMARVDLNVENRSGYSSSSQMSRQGDSVQPALSSSVKTVVVLAVPGSVGSSDISLEMEHYDMQTMTTSSGKVSLMVPLNKSIRLIQLSFGDAYTLAQISSQSPADSYRGISEAFTLTADDDSKTVTINLDTGPAGWIGTQMIGSIGEDHVHGMTIDDDDNIFLVGDATGDMAGQTVDGSSDIVVLKYDRGGNRQSVIYYAPTKDPMYGYRRAYGTDIAVDSSGNLYITGHVEGGDFYSVNIQSLNLIPFLLKTDSAGTALWAKNLGFFGNVTDYQRVAVDGSGYVLAVEGRAGISRFSSDGISQGTTAEMVPTLDGNDRATGIATDSAGNAYVAFYDNSAAEKVILKYDTSVTKTASHPQADATPDDITVDESGNVIVVGNTSISLNGATCGNPGGGDLFVQKFPSDLSSPTWTRLLCSSDVQLDEGKDVKTDSAGNIYVVGQTAGSFTGETNQGAIDFIIAKFDSSGTLQWIDQHGTSGNDYAESIELDSYGYIYISGYTDGAFPSHTNQGSYDIFLLKYTPSGTLME